jgi:benzoate/toluate 1,2-dioxygenase alpha subunit
MTALHSPSHGAPSAFDVDSLVQRGPGTFRVHTRAYSDPEIFQLEMERIFARTWVYVAHESEIPLPGNYKTAHIGQQPVIVARDDKGGINVFYNRCRHRGSVVCREPRGFANTFRCPYHGWIYGKDGRLLGVSMRDGYPADFQQPEGLLTVPRVESYRGLVFACASPDVGPLSEHLGLAAKWIDRRVGMSPVGEIELVSEPYVVEYRGNWKFMIENIIDEYHFAFVHEPFMKLQEKYGDSTGDYGAHVSGSVKNMNERRQSGRRSWGGVGGHGLGERRVGDDQLDELLAGEDAEYYKELLAQHGREELACMVGGGSVMTHPNVGLIHRQIRVVRPLAVDRTEVTIYPYEVKGAPDAHNEGWLRSQERFYGPAGYGMPDDVEMFALNQQGLAASSVDWLILERGLDREEVNERGDRSAPVGGETPLRALWEEWLKLMSRAD